MSIEIRPCTPDEMARFEDNLYTGFSIPPPREQPPEREILPEWTLCAFEDGELATTYAAFPFQLYLHGGGVSAAGVTAVTTLPWYRRRGFLRQIMAVDFRRMKEQGGPPIAVLWASMAAIYQRFGYGIVSSHRKYQIEPRYIQFADDAPTVGRHRLLPREQPETLAPLYEAFAAGRSAYVQRDAHAWKHLTFGFREPRVFCVGYEQAGELQGYVIYTADFKPRAYTEVGPSVVVQARDMVWRTPAAYRALWLYLKQIDLAKSVEVRLVPVDDPAPDLLLEPRQLTLMQGDAILARVVDLERALTARAYSAPADLTFQIADQMAPWNAGCWRLETDGSETRVCRTDRAPDVSMSVNTLAPLLFGHYSASHAARIGRLDVHRPAALADWDAAFRTALPPGCANDF